MRNPFRRKRPYTPEDFHLGGLFWIVWEACVIVDATDGTLVLYNGQAQQLFGYTEQDIGQSILKFVPEADRPVLIDHLRLFAATGGGPLITYGKPYERVVIGAAERYVPVSVTRVPLKCWRSRHRFFLDMARDLSLPSTDMQPSAAWDALGLQRRDS